MNEDKRAEALQLAKEAGFKLPETWSESGQASFTRLIALARASAAPQEPVAWRIKTPGATTIYEDREPRECYGQKWLDECFEVIPLYAHPAAAPQEPVADFVTINGVRTIQTRIPLHLVADGPLYAAPQPQAPSATSDDVRGKALEEAARQIEEADVKAPYRWEYARIVRAMLAAAPQPQASPQAPSQEPVGEVDPPNMSVTWYGDSLKKIDALRTKPFKPVKLYAAPQAPSQEPVADDLPIRDLAAVCGRLVLHLRKLDPADRLAGTAAEYLRVKRYLSPLRIKAMDGSPQPTAQPKESQK